MVGLLAVARVTRLVTTDTLPLVRRPREAWLARWPAPGQVVGDAAIRSIYDDGRRGNPTDSEPGTPPVGGKVVGREARRPDGSWGEVRWGVDGTTGNATWTWVEGHPLGELITCPWCASVYVAAGCALVAAVAPRSWRVLSRVLAGSLVAGHAARLEDR